MLNCGNAGIQTLVALGCPGDSDGEKGFWMFVRSECGPLEFEGRGGRGKEKEQAKEVGHW